ncbi:Uncharacterised protein [BD1-7 clade bacterium]|uniref:tRNA-(Ms[2]io[6]A)-hydroxylase n=1 Tax=BD1-7 clade bacterium TaxID=2029982 RepID=A0A5S9QLB8_9GAMM|nr:Uncharacterised protein [BD1-7 clade bacterium]CAA0121992.1 Uncharacterised protein [BD1-7 clade bacterium]CAA0122659.1 Uncharacterised protein [BD1-7 clade bacterium]
MQAVDPKDLAELLAFLPCETPDSWLDEAVRRQDMLLINHCYLEKCAARSAINMMFRYPDKPDVLAKMSRLAREELVHFEQVSKILKKRGLTYRPHRPSRYVGQLQVLVRNKDPERFVDQLIVGAFIEARSCERFYRLVPHLDDELAKFYTSLLKSEARHYKDYLTLAEKYAAEPIAERIAVFREAEENAILSEDGLFRFHSGVPAASGVRV